MITQDTVYNVKNRSSSVVVYRIPETNVRREFAPGEVQRISFGELEKLTYQAGGKTLLEEFLQIQEEVAATGLNLHRELEYNMNETQIRDLLISGSIDAFLDALDFAPIGVIDLIKSMAVALPLTDFEKRKALKAKTGFDVDKALAHLEEERQEENSNKSHADTSPAKRRVQPAVESTPTRRTTPDYKIVTPTN